MPSDLKSETSRINGAKSHGPKTPEGKETSSQNSLKHGLTSRKTFILQTESPDEYREFLAEHIAIHQPVTPPESELVDQMAIARWRIRRFVGAETVLIDCEMVRNREKVDKEFGPTDSDLHLAMAIRSLADESRCLSLMSRYESRLQRVHDKAYGALRELQQHRTPPSPPVDPSPSASPTAPDPASSPTASPAPPDPAPTTYSPSVSAGAIPTHNPSVSAGSFADHQISPNERGWPRISATPGNENTPLRRDSSFNKLRVFTEEPTDPPHSSPDIHLCPPPPLPDPGNSEDHDE